MTTRSGSLLPALLLFLSTVATAAETPTADRLLKDLATTRSESTRLRDRQETVATALKTGAKILGLPKKHHPKLETLCKTLSTMDDVLGGAQILPKVGTVARKVKERLEPGQKKVCAMARKVGTLKKRMEPVRMTTDVLAKLVAKERAALAALADGAEKGRAGLEKARATARGLPAGKTHDAACTCLDRFSGAWIEPDEKLNAALKKANAELDELEKRLKDLAPVFAPFEELGPILSDIEGLLGPIEGVVLKLGKILDQKITIGFPVSVKMPIKVKIKTKEWYNPLKWRWKISWKITGYKDVLQTKNFSFTVRQILKGIDTGFSKLNKLFLDKVMKLVDPILKPLENLLGPLKDLARLLDRLSAIEIKLKTIELKLKKIIPDLQVALNAPIVTLPELGRFELAFRRFRDFTYPCLAR